MTHKKLLFISIITLLSGVSETNCMLRTAFSRAALPARAGLLKTIANNSRTCSSIVPLIKNSPELTNFTAEIFSKKIVSSEDQAILDEMLLKDIMFSKAKEDINTIKWLIDQGAHIPDSFLNFAIMYGKEDLVFELLKQNFDVNSSSSFEENALHWYCQFSSPSKMKEDKKILHELLKRGAKVNARNIIRQTPLHLAIANLSIDIENIKTVITAGADLNAQDYEGNTPSHIAARSLYLTFFNYPERFKILSDAGADATIKNNEGKTAIDIAKDIFKKSPKKAKVFFDIYNKIN